MKSQEDIFERLCMMLDDNRLDPLGYRRESLLEFTEQSTLLRIKQKYSDKIKEIPDEKEWMPLEIVDEIVKSRIYDVIKREREQNRPTHKMDILDLRNMHRIEAYAWILDDIEALQQFENPRAFIGEKMFEYFMERYGFIEA